MQAVLISINPKWCELIASGKKKIEIRKSEPKQLKLPFKAFIYCTQGKGDCLWRWNGVWYDTQDPNHRPNRLDGKVIGEFICDRIVDIPYSRYYVDYYHAMPQQDFEDACLDMGLIDEYLRSKDGFGWHISDLKIYDKPRELSEFYVWKKCNSCRETGYESTACMYDEDCKVPAIITRPPQSWMYVEVEG